jgi:hypothetical protein
MIETVMIDLPRERIASLVAEAVRRKMTLSDLIREKLGFERLDGENVFQLPTYGTNHRD